MAASSRRAVVANPVLLRTGCERRVSSTAVLARGRTRR